MKHLLSACLLILLCLRLGAEEVDIPLVHHEDKEIEPHLLLIEPCASHDANIIYVYYDIYSPKSILITVKDLFGNLVYTNTISVFYYQPYSFVLSNVTSGEYELTVSYGKKALYGYFSL